MNENIDWNQCPVGATVSSKLDDIHALVKEQNGRLRLAERFIWILTGAVLLLAFIYGKDSLLKVIAGG